MSETFKPSVRAVFFAELVKAFPLSRLTSACIATKA